MRKYSSILEEQDVLPPTLEVWPHIVERSHQPREMNCSSYRPYLRQEFSYQCAFCCIHESDIRPLTGETSEGTGLFATEHFYTVRDHPEKRDEYENTFYICRFCNTARGAKPVESSEGRLINPCTHVWAKKFHVHGETLRFEPECEDAEYTLGSYDLNEERKIAFREGRREIMLDSLESLDAMEEVIEELLEQFDRTGDEKFLKKAFLCERIAVRAFNDVIRFRKVPNDAPTFLSG